MWGLVEVEYLSRLKAFQFSHTVNGAFLDAYHIPCLIDWQAIYTHSRHIYGAESKERPLAEVSSQCDRMVPRLSHIHAHCQKEKKKPVWLILASWEACLFPLQFDQMVRSKKRRSFHYTSRSWLHHIKRQKACQSIAMKTDKKKKPSLSMVSWSRIACCIDNVASKLVLSKFSIENCSE